MRNSDDQNKEREQKTKGYGIALKQTRIKTNTYNFGKIPFLVAEGTDGAGLEPTLDAIEVKDVTAIPKSNGQAIVVGRTGIGLILDGGFVERIAANGALIVV